MLDRGRGGGDPGGCGPESERGRTPTGGSWQRGPGRASNPKAAAGPLKTEHPHMEKPRRDRLGSGQVGCAAPTRTAARSVG